MNLAQFRNNVAHGLAAILLLVGYSVASAPADAASGSEEARTRIPASARTSHSGVIPPIRFLYGELSERWWQWAYSFPAAQVPFFNAGGPVDLSAHQSGPVWFLAGGSWDLGPVTRTGVVPFGKFLFLPVANVINDYPCPPPPPFEPDPGESLEEFLVRTGNDYLSPITDLFAEIDGAAVRNLAAYRITSDLFTFRGDPALASMRGGDPCVNGSMQKAVSLGYWLLLAPLPPGQHTIHFGSPTWKQNITYVLTVTNGR